MGDQMGPAKQGPGAAPRPGQKVPADKRYSL